VLLGGPEQKCRVRNGWIAAGYGGETRAVEMQQVRYFVALCDTLNFTRAAERCNVTQPSLTRAIKLLEDELGGPLFHRERNHTHLTELGKRVEPHLRAAAQDTVEARRQAMAFASLRAPVLRVGIARRISLKPLLDVFGRFARKHPDAEVTVPSAETADLLEILRRGDLEVVIVPHDAAEEEDLHYYPVAHDRPQVVLPETHGLAGQASIRAEELAGETIVCVDRCPYWLELERVLSARGAASRPHLVVGRVPWFLDLVRAGFGIGLLSCHQDLGHGLVGLPLADPTIDTELTLATKRGRLYSPPVRAFVEIALAPPRMQTPQPPA
jgi:LysR family hydrogen peroxide-inducible transcriptional activator